MGVEPKIGVENPPKWMVKIRVPNPIKMDDLEGNTPIFGNTQMKITPALGNFEIMRRSSPSINSQSQKQKETHTQPFNQNISHTQKTPSSSQKKCFFSIIRKKTINPNRFRSYPNHPNHQKPKKHEKRNRNETNVDTTRNATASTRSVVSSGTSELVSDAASQASVSSKSNCEIGVKPTRCVPKPTF